MRNVQTLVVLVILLASEVSLGEEVTSKAVICLATLAHWNAWSKNPSGGQSSFGKYLRTSKDIQEFKSGDGKYLYYCEVKGDRVHLASAQTAFETQPNFNYTRTDYQHFYVVKKPDITITTKYPDGSEDEKTFSIKGLEKKL